MKTTPLKTTPFQIDTEIFARVASVNNLELLAKSRRVQIGVGSATGALENSARSGVGQFTLIDKDVVERSNVATQGYLVSDIGRPKVVAMAERLRAINPAVAVQAVYGSFHDLTDDDIKRLTFDPFVDSATSALAPGAGQTVLVGATDDFFCQARVNSLALHFGIPSICCQHYAEGLASEITFTHPVTVRACHRCILSSRYEAYLNNGFKNPVGSAGSPISSSGRINSLCTDIEMAILHHGTKQPRWGDLLVRIGDRNLLQIRCHPDAENLLGLNNFSQAFSAANSDQIFFGETIWRRQIPEHPNTGYSRPCPDCGGTGNLTQRIGAFADTRIINS